MSLNDIKLLQNVNSYDVEYVDIINLKDELEKMVTNEGKSILSHKVYTTKRTGFAYEEEIRLLSTEINNLNRLHQVPILKDFMLQDIKSRFDQGHLTKPEYENRLKSIEEEYQPIQIFKEVPFRHIDNFIKSVLLNPLSPDWFDDTLRAYCENNKINYLGKSDLYSLKIR